MSDFLVTSIVAVCGFFALVFTFLFSIFMRLLPLIFILGARWFAADYFEVKETIDAWRQSLEVSR